jgi:hypothetical protein
MNLTVEFAKCSPEKSTANLWQHGTAGGSCDVKGMGTLLKK